MASSCEYNRAYAPPTQFERSTLVFEENCETLTTKEECELQGYCWWRNTTNQNNLAEHQQTMVPAMIYEPLPGVYVAVGYDLGNSILIVNEGRSVVIDTLGSTASGAQAVQAFEEYLGSPIPPIEAVIYTHSHGDHFYGTLSFPVPDDVPIYAHETFFDNLQKTFVSLAVLRPRTGKQFGVPLQETVGEDVNGFLGNAIGPFISQSNDDPLLFPNTFFASSLNVTHIGLEFQMYYTPGETDDTISVYLPSLGAVAVGDNLYRSFSNLYAIRGTPPRNVKKWYQSLDLLRSLSPTVILGSHSAPVTEDVTHILLTYRDAIAYVHDQTIALFDQGLHPDDIANLIALPEYLASEPYLQQFYGYLPWCAKSIFTSYLGWFSGDIAELNVLSTEKQAQRLVQLAGGVVPAISAAAAALNEGDLEGAQWALQLATAINRTIPRDSPHLPYLYDIYLQAAQQLAYSQTSANGRNFYLTTLYELFSPPSAAAPADVSSKDQTLWHAPLHVFMDVLTVRLNRVKSKDIILHATISFPTEEYVAAVRREVVEIYPSSFRLTKQYDCTLSMRFTSPYSFKSLILSYSSLSEEIASGKLISDNPVAEIAFFFDLFQK